MRIAMLAQAGSAHIARWSTGLAARGHDIRCLSNSTLMVHPPGIDTVFLPGASPVAYFKNIPRVRRLLKDFRPEIVHAHYATGYGLWGTFQRQAPLVVSVWGTDIEDAMRKRFTLGPITRRALVSARIITATSRYLLGRTAAFEPSVASRMEYVPFGVPISDKGDVENKRQSNTVRIIFAKAFHRGYAPELVIRAFASAHKAAPQIRLTMIGGGPLEQELKRLALDLGMDDYVDIRGHVLPEEATRLIGEADMMVMPSKRESFGVAAVEAASFGVPVIATAVGGIPEIVEDGVNGILISPGDSDALANAIIRLAVDEDLRRRMGEAGKTIARQRFDFERSLDRMEAIYAKAAAGQ